MQSLLLVLCVVSPIITLVSAVFIVVSFQNGISNNKQENSNVITTLTKTVDEKLAQVQRGLGEMKDLATNVGDLKNMLMNPKRRGHSGELLLDSILQDVLTEKQYKKQLVVNPDKTDERGGVDFAIVLPDAYLPIDVKYPKEDYERLLDAYESADKKDIEEAKKAFSKARIVVGPAIVTLYSLCKSSNKSSAPTASA